MLNPRVLLALAFKKMLYDDSRKIGNPVPPALQWRCYGWLHLGRNFVVSPLIIMYGCKRLYFEDSGTTSLLQIAVVI